MKYQIGTKVMVEFTITKIDNSSCPYFLDSELLDGAWLQEGHVTSLLEYNNPEAKRKRIQSEIENLQKELEDINDTN